MNLKEKKSSPIFIPGFRIAELVEYLDPKMMRLAFSLIDPKRIIEKKDIEEMRIQDAINCRWYFNFVREKIKPMNDGESKILNELILEEARRFGI